MANIIVTIVTETETKKLNEKTYIWRYKDGDGDGLAWLGLALWHCSVVDLKTLYTMSKQSTPFFVKIHIHLTVNR